MSGSFDWDKNGEDDELAEKFTFHMEVTRIEDRPRPSRSYTEEQWRALLACGYEVDEVLKANDVRLTMGGEPTFVSIDDMEERRVEHLPPRSVPARASSPTSWSGA